MRPVGTPATGTARAAALAAALACAGTSSAEAEPREIGGGAWVDTIAGGPALLLLPQRSVPMFSCTVLVPAGSALETKETSGAAHYLEHLLFNGTSSRTREEIYARADFLGAYHNASTQRERTVFQLLLPSENWREGLELQSDMLLHSTLPPAMFEKEKGIILEELAKDQTDATYEADLTLQRALYGEDSRALPVLGTKKSITSMDLEALRHFYRERYHPSGMTIVAMGDFDLFELHGELVSLYSGREGSPSPLPPRPGFPHPPRFLSRRVDGLAGVHVRVLLPFPAVGSSQFTACTILARTLESGEGGALARPVESRGQTVMSSYVTLDGGRPWSLLTLGVDLPQDGDAKAAVRAILDHLGRLAEVGPEPSDVGSARRGIEIEELFLREKMHYYGLMRADLLGAAGPGAPEQMLREAESATPDKLAALVHRALVEGRALAVATGPSLKDSDDELTLPVPPESSGVRGGEATAGSVLAREAELSLSRAEFPAASTSISRETRPDGSTLVLHTSPEGRSFAMHLSFRDRRGAEIAANVPFGTADVLHRMLELGSASRTRDELRGRIAELGLVLKVTDSDFVPYDDYYFSAEHSYVRVESVDNACEEALLLLAELLSSPRFEETAFSTALAAAIARSEKDRDSPAERAELAYYSALGDAHPLAEGPLGDPEKLRALTLEHVKRFHSRYFRPERAVIAISASVDPGRIRSALETTPLFASAPTSLETSEASAWRGRPIEGRVETIVELGREQSYLIVGAPLEPIAETEEAALRLAVAVLSERLSERLREEEGLAYSIGASVRFASPGPNVRMSAGTRSGNLERLEEGMRAVVKSLIESPPGEEEIAGARNRAEGQRRMRRLARIGQAYALATEELHGRDPRELDSDLPGLRAVGPAEVLRASERYLGFESSIVAIAK